VWYVKPHLASFPCGGVPHVVPGFDLLDASSSSPPPPLSILETRRFDNTEAR